MDGINFVGRMPSEGAGQSASKAAQKDEGAFIDTQEKVVKGEKSQMPEADMLKALANKIKSRGKGVADAVRGGIGRVKPDIEEFVDRHKGKAIAGLAAAGAAAGGLAVTAAPVLAESAPTLQASVALSIDPITIALGSMVALPVVIYSGLHVYNKICENSFKKMELLLRNDPFTRMHEMHMQEHLHEQMHERMQAEQINTQGRNNKTIKNRMLPL